MEISEGKSSVTNSTGNVEGEKTVTGQAVSSINASNNVLNEPLPAPFLDLRNRLYNEINKTNNVVENLSTTFEEYYKQKNMRDEEYRIHFDKMYAKVLEETDNNVPRGDNGADNAPKAGSSSNEAKAVEMQIDPHEINPGNLALTLDSSLFGTGEGHWTMADSVDALRTCVDDERKAELNKWFETNVDMASTEQETASTAQSNMRVVPIQKRNHEAKPLQPQAVLAERQNAFQVNVNVALFDAENITCSVGGGKIEVHASATKQDQYGSQKYSIHQVFEVPPKFHGARYGAAIAEKNLVVLFFNNYPPLNNENSS